MPLQIRRGTEAERLVMTTPLAQGELLYVTDDQRLYIGNGSTLGGVQITGYTNEDAMDAAAGMFTSGVHTGITFTYGITQDAAGRIDVAVDLTNYNGSISGDLVGSVFSDTSTRLIDGTNGKFNLNGTINGHIIPDDSETYDLGSGSYRFRDLWLSGSSIHLGNALITSSGSAVNLPAGSTVNGIAIGSGSTTGDGVIEGSTYKINIAADDSSLMLNTDLETVTAAGGFFGNLTGNVTGNLTGDVTGNLTGDVTGNLTGNVTGNVTGNLTGDVTGNVTGNLSGAHQGDLYATDFTKLVDATTKEFAGSLTGNVYSTDSTLVFDSTTKEITADGGFTGDLNTDNIYANDSGIGLNIRSKVGNSFCVDYYAGTKDSPVAIAPGDNVGAISIKGWNGSIYAFAGTIFASWEGTANTSTDYPSSTLYLAAGNNTSNPVVASLNSVGTFEAPTLKVGSYTSTPDTRPTGSIGMIIYNTTTNKFQGYANTGWVDLS